MSTTTKVAKAVKHSIQHVKESRGILTCAIDLSLVDLPMVQKMLVLEQLRKSFESLRVFFKFDDETQKYWEDTEVEFRQALREEDSKFASFREMVLAQAVGPLYESIHNQIEIVKAVYRYEAGFVKAQEARTPSVLYKVAIAHGDMTLKIVNLKDFEYLSYKARSEWVSAFLNMLDYQHAKRLGQTKRKVHQSHVGVRRFLYPGDNVKFEGVCNFVGEDAVLTGLIHDGLEKLPNPEQILRMVVLLEKAVAYKSTKPIMV